MATLCSIKIIELRFNQNFLKSIVFLLAENKFNEVYFSLSEKKEFHFAFLITAIGSTYSENKMSSLLQNSEYFIRPFYYDLYLSTKVPISCLFMITFNYPMQIRN
jgi:hypothetical protein